MQSELLVQGSDESYLVACAAAEPHVLGIALSGSSASDAITTCSLGLVNDLGRPSSRLNSKNCSTACG